MTLCSKIDQLQTSCYPRCFHLPVDSLPVANSCMSHMFFKIMGPGKSCIGLGLQGPDRGQAIKKSGANLRCQIVLIDNLVQHRKASLNKLTDVGIYGKKAIRILQTAICTLNQLIESVQKIVNIHRHSHDDQRGYVRTSFPCMLQSERQTYDPRQLGTRLLRSHP